MGRLQPELHRRDPGARAGKGASGICERPLFDPVGSAVVDTFRIKPAVTWPGGKGRLLKHILPLIPAHTCYVEAFAGGLAVLLAKERSQIEVVNDFDGDLVNFYRCVRFHQEPLIAELEFVLNSREEFNDFIDQRGLTDLQRAARWFFRNRTCFRGANMETFGVSPISPGGASSSRAARLEAIRQLSFRLDRVVIEQLDWKRVLDAYDRPSTFFFLDPPYTACADLTYKGWTTADVLYFRERLARLKGRWLVTLNDAPEIRRAFAGCHFTAIERAKGVTNGRYKEIVITPAEAGEQSPSPRAS